MLRFATLTVAVLAVAALAAGPETKNMLKPTTDPASWRLEQHEKDKAAMSVDGDALLVDVQEIDDTDWHVQIVQTDLDLEDGKDYTLTFKAKASEARSIPVNASIDQDDYHGIGLAETADLTADWKDFSYDFKADQTVKGKNRVSLILGSGKGKVWVKEMALTQK